MTESLPPAIDDATEALEARAAALARRLDEADAPDILRTVLRQFRGRIALVSSFGAESAVLLHLAAAIDPATPVLFLNTGKLFGETLRYKRELTERLGLTAVQEILPDPGEVKAADPNRDGWRVTPDLCCQVRKTLPLRRALAPYDAWITGRKRFQTGTRASMGLVEAAEGRLKINPLASWTRRDIESHLDRHGLPRHPLEADGFLSIGCMPCTDRVRPGEDARAGRWRGQDKTECGIHLPLTA